MEFAIVDNQVVVRGTPANIVRYSESIASNLVITDGEETQKVSLVDTLFGPIVLPMPKINPLADGESYTEDGVMYNAYYTSPFYYFIDLEFPGLTISEDGEYPSGIYGRQEGTNYGS